MKIKTVLSIFAVTAFCHASAEVLVVWENDHLGGNEASTTAGEAPSAGSWHADLAAAPLLTRGEGGTVTTYTNTFGMRNANSLTLADAIESNRYLTFTLNAQSGKAMNLTNIFARLQAQNATAYEVYFTLMSDATGFNAGEELTTWVVGGTGDSADWLGQVRTFDLSGVADLQNITDVEFRIYIYGQIEQFAQTGFGRAFTINGNADLRVEGDIIEGGDPDPEVELQSIHVNTEQAVVTWSAPPDGYLTSIWWMPEVYAQPIDQVELVSDLPHTQLSFIDDSQHTEERGFYRTESYPAP